jgi:hypothetical protein
MQVYEYGIDVIFLCICHDLEFNEDKNDWWPLMSKELQMLTNVKNLPTNTNKVNPESTEKTVAMRQAFVDDL